MLKDYFNKDATSLKNKKLWLFDMDGTIYEDNRIFDGTLTLLNKIREDNNLYVFITNNSSKSVDDYLNKVKKMGIVAERENFFTSVDATILMLKEKYPGKLVYVQGTTSMYNQLLLEGVNVTTDVRSDIDIVLIGFDTELSFEKLSKTCEILSKNKDVLYFATNPDYTCPVSYGFVPDCGSMAISINYATKRTPIFIGKPEPTMVNIVLNKLNIKKEDCVVVGDRIYTDIKSGYNAGVDTICVLSGECTLEDVLNSDVLPTYTFNSVKDIVF